MQPARRPRVDVALLVWPLLLAVVLVWPILWQPGHPLARDLVFVPEHAWTAATVGLGDASPRAVPLDAVVALLTTLVDGGLVARIVLPLIPALAGWGVLRLLRGVGVGARLAASGFAVWNPYVVERLALGQWALLASYAALPWLMLAAARYREQGRGVDLGAATWWSALASLTPTGGVLAVVGLVVAGWQRSLRGVVLLVLGLALQAPWLVAAFAGTAGQTSDPDAVAVFAPDTDGPGGPVVALLGLGGIWDDQSEPAIRGTWVALVAAAITVVVLAGGFGRLRTLLPYALAIRWAWFALAGALLALLGAVPLGQDLLREVVSTIPGGGLLRDSQKFLAPAVMLVALCLGALTDRFAPTWTTWAPELRITALIPIVSLPLLLMPDATTVTWPTVAPVRYPSDFDAVDAAVSQGPDNATLVTLPWRAYRAFEWGSGLTSSDPALRWFEADVLVSDDLQVGDVLVSGESARAASVGSALATGSPAEVLGPLGVTWVVVYPDDPAAEELDLAGLEPVHLGEDVRIYRVPDVTEPPPVSRARRVAVATGWSVSFIALVVGLVAATRRLRLEDVSR
jgi:hypothetical protein